MAVTVLVARPDGSLLTDVPLGDLKPYLDDEACRVWVDLLEPEMEDYEALKGCSASTTWPSRTAITGSSGPRWTTTGAISSWSFTG